MKTKTVSLRQCLELIIDRRGVTPKKLKSTWKADGYKVLSANNVKSSSLQNTNQIRFVDADTYHKWMKTEIEKDDILLTSEAPAGEALLWDSDEKIVVGQRLYALRVRNTVNPWYLTYYLQSNRGQKEIQNKCSGSTVFGISEKMFDYIDVVLPDKTEQDKIASCIATLEFKIDNNKKIINQLESLAKTIYDYWFVQFDFPDKNGRPYKSSGGKMVWNERLQREIPDGWEVGRLGNHIKIDRGISYSSDELMPDGIPMINLNSFHSNATYKVEGIKKYSGSYKKINLIQPYDLLICMTQQSPIDITGSSDIIGKAIILPDCFSESEVVMSMDVARLKCDQKYGRYYLKRLLDKDFFHKYMVGFASGTKIKHLHINGLMEYRCEIPDSNLIRKYNQISYTIYCKISEIIKENQQLASLREFLLPLLMNGQVSFKSDSI